MNVPELTDAQRAAFLRDPRQIVDRLPCGHRVRPEPSGRCSTCERIQSAEDRKEETREDGTREDE